MTKKFLIILVSVIAAVTLFAGGFLLGFNFTGAKQLVTNTVKNATENTQAAVQNPAQAPAFNRDAALKSLGETLDHITSNALTTKTPQELVTAAIEAMLATLGDKYADYFPPAEYAQIVDSYSGTMSGIGVVVTVNDNNQIVMVNIIEGTPAFEKGLKIGDIIISVNGTNIEGMALDKVVAMIKGEEGTEVNLAIFRPSENKNIDFTIKRKRFYVPNFLTEVKEGNIVYIQYIDFQENGAQKLEEKLNGIINDQTQGIILDLRNNLGGILDDAVSLCDLFMDSGTVVTVKGRTNNQDSFEEFKAKNGGFTKIPMVVIINGYSASASELAAGALKDSKRATLVGEKSFGKGTVQILEKLSDGSGIKFTTAKYYLPSGVTIDGVGIQPDINVVLKPEDTVDLQLNRALEEIKKMVSE